MEIHLQVIDHVVAMKKVIVGQKVFGQKVLTLKRVGQKVSGKKYCISGQKVLIFFSLHLLLYKTYVSHCTFTAQRSICYLYICC